MQVWQQYNSVDYAMQRYKVYEMSWENIEDYDRKYVHIPAEEKTHVAAEITIGRTFEGLSLLLQKKLIDTEWLYLLYGGDIIRWWEKFQPFFEESIAKGYMHPWPLVVPLYNKMKSIREQRRTGKILYESIN